MNSPITTARHSNDRPHCSFPPTDNYRKPPVHFWWSSLRHCFLPMCFRYGRRPCNWHVRPSIHSAVYRQILSYPSLFRRCGQRRSDRLHKSDYSYSHTGFALRLLPARSPFHSFLPPVSGHRSFQVFSVLYPYLPIHCLPYLQWWQIHSWFHRAAVYFCIREF